MGRIKAVFNWSGGKDSAHALMRILESGIYDPVALLTTVNLSTQESTMHGIPRRLLEAQAHSIGIPLHIVDLVPQGNMSDYKKAMTCAVNHFKKEDISHFIFGDIFLHDVRRYREEQLAPLGIQVVEPLWNNSSEEIMDRFLHSKLRTVIVTTQADKLGPEYIGREIDQTLIKGLPPETDPNGENGEYHTFCFDGPIFRKPIPFRLAPPQKKSFKITLDSGESQTFHYWHADFMI